MDRLRLKPLEPVERSPKRLERLAVELLRPQGRDLMIDERLSLGRERHTKSYRRCYF